MSGNRTQRRLRTTILLAPLTLLLAATPALAAPAAPAAKAPPSKLPTSAPGNGPAKITGPIPAQGKPGDPAHDYVFYSTPYDLKKAGYEEEEFFISGTATRYNPNPTVDEQKQVATTLGTTPYTTRIVVRRPVKPAKSAGVAVVDWQNVTAGHDIDTEWGTSADYYVRNGWTWVGASVQRVGVNGATAGGTAGLGLTQWSPQRYGSLDVTNGGAVLDDSQSFDIYTQIAQLLKGRGKKNPLADLGIDRVYAGGASQSGRYLGVYYNTVQPLRHVYDGFLFALSDSSLPPRDGVGTKAIRVYTENDVYRGAGVPSKTAPDSDSLRTWEIAGASHVPAYSTGTDPNDFRTTLGAIQSREFGEQAPFSCTNPGPSQVESWTVFHAAYDALDKWVSRGIAPRRAAPLALIDPGPPADIARDANGIAQGGIRLPDVEAPTGLNDGINSPANLDNPLSSFCVLYGTHRDFDAAQLKSLYYNNNDYRQQVADVVQRLETQHFLLPEDGRTLINQAAKRKLF
ncbi:alpha/beta hydrolase domain-containing protein [Amycolatopsis sp. NPDC005232]|uniref:alpha/beta hydrolase domain-containing protein n=1 Tax=Amycolatopsis sp. NPDC005232 TaxID=3157027 RepID=UPI0033B48C21